MLLPAERARALCAMWADSDVASNGSSLAGGINDGGLKQCAESCESVRRYLAVRGVCEVRGMHI